MEEAWVERRQGTAAWWVCAAAVVVRVAVGLHSYSGRGDTPKFGDYEAQRHWMEITLNLPVGEWYVDTKDNDLGYWGIDYPPLSAYQSWLHGLLLLLLEPQAVALGESRGYETGTSKVLMRATALASDVSLMFPAAILAMRAVYPGERARDRLWALALVLFHPSFVLIDHGHFQYNCISLGLTAGAVACLWRGRQYAGSFLYVLALNHKHMSLYYALAFFSYLLGGALRRPGLVQKFTTVCLLGLTVVLTFALVWFPFLREPGMAFKVLGRLVPLRRGVFEDYVSNFWCVSHVLIKWKRLFANEVMANISALATMAACAPSVVHQVLWPSKKGFLICMLNCSLAFYLFSFQVHEKSILLPCLPSALLVLENPMHAVYFALVSTFSMLPLLVKDGLVVAYGGCLIIFCAVAGLRTDLLRPAWMKTPLAASAAIGVALSALKVAGEPPASLPYLFDLFISAFAFVHFAGFFVFWNWKLWTSYKVADKVVAKME